MTIKKISLYLLLFQFISLIGCYEAKVGCLDYLAANYTPSSDEACDNCCVYPAIQLRLDHTFKNKKLIFGDTLNNGVSSFYLIDQKFYLDGITLFSEGVHLPYITSTIYTIDNQEINYTDDIALIEKAAPTYAYNTIRTSLSPDSLIINHGIDPKFNKVDTKKLTNTSPLSLSKKMYNDSTDTYIGFYLSVIGGSDLKDTMTFQLLDTHKYHLSLKGIHVIKGQPITLPIIVDYDRLFKNIDFTKDEQSVGEMLSKNMQLGFIRS